MSVAPNRFRREKGPPAHLAGKKIVVSFSGGKTSAYMVKRMLDAGLDILPIYANTGQEHDETLDFIHLCDKTWGLNLVWVEAVFNLTKGKGVRHKIVSYETAVRASDPIKGTPFAMLMEKNGIVTVATPKCSDRLKGMPIYDWKRDHGLLDAPHAIGIRWDEMDRFRPGFIYPLASWWPTTKEDVEAFWETQPFTLNLKPHQGNCMWCFKKSDGKLERIAEETPEAFRFPRWVEKKYGTEMPMFRKGRTVADIFAKRRPDADDSDGANKGHMGCGETCEPFFTPLMMRVSAKRKKE